MKQTEPGRLISERYRLVAVIGHGGMGRVWRGRDEVLDRDVAVKQILWPPHLTELERQVACHRATREAQVAGRLSHHNVVRVYDIAHDDGCPWIIMEYLPYQSLRDLVAGQGPLSPAQAAAVGLGVLAALRAAHAQGILHRDVKPANILAGRDGRVVLTDFGIARAADLPTLTTSGALFGSPSYIAPERARGRPAGTSADLWGLGASLYAAVEGRPPFERNGALPTLTAVVADELEPPLHAGPLRPLIDGLLRKDPDRRLGAAQADQLLRQVLDSARARRPVPRPWERKAAARARRAAVAAAPAARPRPAHPALTERTAIHEPVFTTAVEPLPVAPQRFAPVAVVPERVAPASVVPEPVVPEPVVPEPVAPERVAPEPVTPVSVTPEAVAPERFALEAAAARLVRSRPSLAAVAALCLFVVTVTAVLLASPGSPVPVILRR